VVIRNLVTKKERKVVKWSKQSEKLRINSNNPDMHHGKTSQNILNVSLRNTFGTLVQFFLNFPGLEHHKHTTQETARCIVNEPLRNTRSIFFQKIQGVPKNYLIRTLWLHHLGNCEFTRHFLC
jgi:hypothetical protein